MPKMRPVTVPSTYHAVLAANYATNHKESRFAYHILAEMCGVPVAVATEALEIARQLKFVRKNKNGNYRILAKGNKFLETR